MHGSLVQQPEDCQLDGLRTSCHRPIVAIYPRIANVWYIADADRDAVTSVTGRTASPTRPFLGRLRNLVQRGRQAEGGLGRRAQPTPGTQDGRLGAGRRGQEGPERQERQERHASAPRWARTASPRRSAPAAPRSAGCCSTCCWSAWSACSWPRAASSTSTRRPSCPTRTPTSRPTRRSSTTTTARPSWASYAIQNRDAIPYDRDAPGRQGRRGRRGEPHLLERQRDRLQGHRPRRVQQRLGQRHPGRVDDHPAVHQDPLPHPGALLHAQAQGGDPLPQAGPHRSTSRRSSRATSTPSTSAAAPTASRPPRRPTSTSPPPSSTSRRARRWRASSTTRATSTRPTARTSKIALRERYRYVLDGMAKADKISADEAAKAAKGCRSSSRRQADDTYGGQKGHVLTMVKNELLNAHQRRDRRAVHRGRDRRRRPAGDHDVHPEGDGRGRGGRRTRSGPEGPEFSDKNLHVGVASVQVDTGAVRGIFAGQDFLEVPDQLGGRRRAGAARRSSRSRWPPGSRRASRSRTPSTATRPSSSRTAPTIRNEGDNDYGSAVNLLKATEDSINTAFTDLTVSIPDGPQKVLEMMNAMGIPPNKGPGKTPTASPSQRRARPVPEHHAGQRDDQPDQHGQRLRHHRQRRPVPRAVHHREGRVDKDGEVLYDHSVSDKQVIDAGPGLRHRRRRQLRAAAGRRSPAPAPPRWGSAARPPARPAPRPTRHGRGRLGVVHRLHAAAGDVGHVRPRQGQRAARRLAAVVLRRRLPGRHVDRDHEARHGGRRGGGLPAAGVRRRRGARRGPPADAAAEADQEADPDRDAEQHRPADQDADRRCRRRPCRPSRRRPRRRPPPPPTTPTDIPTPTPSCDILGCPTPTPSATATATRAAGHPRREPRRRPVGLVEPDALVT